MPLNPLIWHFHRVEDATRYIDFFDTGISNSLTLFAPRRKGKTALLLNDIRPLARDRGYNVVYCTFWDNKDRPAQALLTAIEHANEPVSITQRMKALLSTRVSDLSLAVADVRVGVRLDIGKDSMEDVMHKLSQAFHDIAKSRKRTLFLLDEIQHLATRSEFETLVATLRSAFDKYQDKLCALYTGSSRDGLHRLFREQRSPLFNAAQEYPLPDMGADFVQFVSERFEAATGRTFSLAKAQNVWRKVDKSPYHFMAIVERMITHIEQDIARSCEAYLKAIDEDPAILRLVQSLKPIDRVVLLHIHHDGHAIYAVDSLAEIARQLGVDSVTRAEVQSAIRRLRSRDIVCKVGEGAYGVEMAEIVPLVQRSI